MGTFDLLFIAMTRGSQIDELCPQNTVNKCDLFDSVQWDFPNSFLLKS